MKVAIVGASGFIGQMLVKKCLEEKHDVTCFDFHPLPQELLESQGVTYIHSNSSKEELTKHLVGMDAVVCLAAIRPLKEFGLKEYAINVSIATNVMEACLAIGLKNAVFISSRSVYSNEELPWQESKSNIALNLYGEAKAAVDQLVLFMNKYHGTYFKSLRLAQVLGIGEVKGFLINTLIDNAKERKTSKIYGTGCGKKQLVYIKDVINCILKACEQSTVEGVFNIGFDESLSIAELANLIYRVFDNKGNYVFDENYAEDKKVYEMSVDKMKDVLHFTPTFTLETALEDIKKDLNNESGK